MLSKESLQELSAILKTEYGHNLSPGEVFEVGQNLVSFFDQLSRLDFQDKKNDFKGVAPK